MKKEVTWFDIKNVVPDFNGLPEQCLVYCPHSNPKISTTLCAVHKDGKFYNLEEYQSDDAIENINSIDITPLVTHWMPLPKGPNEL